MGNMTADQLARKLENDEKNALSTQFSRMFRDAERPTKMELHPVIRALFSQNLEKQSAITHLDYMSAIETPHVIDQLILKLQLMFSHQIKEYGQKAFETMMKQTHDRKSVIKLINGDVTFT